MKGLVGIADGRLEPAGHGLGLDHRTDLDRRAVELCRVLDVDFGDPRRDPRPEAGPIAEGRVGGRGDDESGGDGEPGRCQLAEVRSLAAHSIPVGAAQGVEGEHRLADAQLLAHGRFTTMTGQGALWITLRETEPRRTRATGP